MKKILVGLDGSPRAAVVLEAAIALAKKTGAKLLLFRSIGVSPDLPGEVYAMSPEEIPMLLERRAQTELETMARAIPPEHFAGTSVVMGTPWQSIDAAAEKEDVDLIMIGAHGYGGLDRVLGTTAAKVVNHAQRSVLVVRAADRLSA